MSIFTVKLYRSKGIEIAYRRLDSSSTHTASVLVSFILIHTHAFFQVTLLNLSDVFRL